MKTNNRLKTKTLHVHHAFFVHLLPFLHDYEVQMPNRPLICCFMEDANKRQRIFFSPLNLTMAFRNQIQEGSPTFDKVSG